MPIFFSKMAMVTFGGAYAVLAYVAQQAVENYGWLKPGEMLDGLGMAETTPGPLIMVLQFVGFMAAFRDPGSLSPMMAGTLGGLLATWVTFTPCFLWIFLGAPFIEVLRGNRALNGALSGHHRRRGRRRCSTSRSGSRSILIFRDTVPIRAFPLSFDAPRLASVDWLALALSVAAAVAIFRFKVGMIPTLAACCGVGLALYLWERSREASRHACRDHRDGGRRCVRSHPGRTVGTTTTFDSTQSEFGTPPPDFDFLQTGEGEPGRWTVVRDTTAMDGTAIEHVSTDQHENRFSLAIYAPISSKDFKLQRSIQDR